MTRAPVLLLVLSIAAPVAARSDIDEAAAAGAAPPPAGSAATPGTPASGAAADESIYIVQRRVYSKSGTFEITPLFYTSLNNKFVGHLGVGLALAYHVRENLAIELQSTIPHAMAQFYSALVFEVSEQESLTPEVVDLKQMDYFGAVSVLFSGLYGKMEFYGFLIDFDFFVTAGVGLVSTLEVCPPNPPNAGNCSADVGIGLGLRSPERAGERYKLSGNLGGGMRFFFSDRIGLRLEIRDIVYSDLAVGSGGETTTDIRNHVLLITGLSILF